MRLLVANNAVPFSRGLGELLADRLVVELRRAGHDVELLRLPLGKDHRQVLESVIAAATLQITNVDRVIGLRFPAYLIPHDDVVIWLVHQSRHGDDPTSVGWPSDPTLDPIAGPIHAADQAAFANANRLYTISPTVADRIKQSHGIAADVLMAPPDAEHNYRTLPAEDFILALGRISEEKRQQLAVQAMRYVQPGYRLVVAGAPESTEMLDKIEREIDVNGLGDRVELIPRFITDEEKLDLLSRCIASVYLPVEADSYGYVCYAAAMSNKPTITATDSGVALTLVDNGRTGLVCAPEAEAIAAGFDELAMHRDQSETMGRMAGAQVLELDLTWTRVVSELTR